MKNEQIKQIEKEFIKFLVETENKLNINKESISVIIHTQFT